jgi:hypothetical protein
MKYMFCRNRIKNYETWKAIFDSHAEAHRAAGLHLKHLWREVDDSNQIYFLFEISNLEAAKAFVNAPEAAAAGHVAGVLDGEIYYLESNEGY